MKILKSILATIVVVLIFILYRVKCIVLRLAGYRKIESIKIPADRTRPKEQCLNKWRGFYRAFQKLPPIVIDRHGFLLDGFSVYIVAYEMDFEWIKVIKVR